MSRKRTVPLARARILVTRAEERDGPLCRLLRARGATVVHWPAYRIVPGPLRGLKASLAALESYDWIAFTSANAVHAVARCGVVLGKHPRIAVVGESTGAAVRELGWTVALRPRIANGEALARALIRRGIRGRRVLFPRSERAPSTFADALEAAGARVDSVVAYRLAPLRAANGSRGARARHRFDAVTFTSPSTIDGLETRLGAARVRELLARTPAIVIGSTTARALAERGVHAARQARPTTLAGLVTALERTLQRDPLSLSIGGKS
ncbi:MAG: uroporphyrinogen-III synthase [Steroidobacteraceae bacterium]